tara:strand:+ start:1254 stop:1730 length:477 start_codon:yes stop_codon:yes gene_type:complete
MNENYDNLSDALDVQYEEHNSEEKQIVKKVESLPVTKEKMEKDLSTDYSEVRRNLKDLIKIGEGAVDGILNVASDTDLPRAYEVAGQMIKNLAEMNKDLLEMHNKMKTIQKEETTVNNNTTNSIYVGSTSDLQDLINQSRSAKKALNDYNNEDVENDE